MVGKYAYFSLELDNSWYELVDETLVVRLEFLNVGNFVSFCVEVECAGKAKGVLWSVRVRMNTDI